MLKYNMVDLVPKFNLCSINDACFRIHLNFNSIRCWNRISIMDFQKLPLLTCAYRNLCTTPVPIDELGMNRTLCLSLPLFLNCLRDAFENHFSSPSNRYMYDRCMYTIRECPLIPSIRPHSETYKLSHRSVCVPGESVEMQHITRRLKIGMKW